MENLNVAFSEEGKETRCFVFESKTDVCVMAISRCHEDDLYSRRIGQRIAYIRAMEKYWREKYNRLKKEIKQLTNALVYVYPNKIQGFGVNATRSRFEAYISQKQELCNEYKANKEDYRKQLQEYFSDMKKTKEIIDNLKNGKEYKFKCDLLNSD